MAGIPMSEMLTSGVFRLVDGSNVRLEVLFINPNAWQI